MTAPTSNKRKLSKAELEKVTDGSDTKIQRRFSGRLAKKWNHTTKPTLTFTSSYKGVKTQKLNSVQSIYFKQTATLRLNAVTVHDIAHYYEFRQFVRDTYTDLVTAKALEPAPVQDDNYEPDYESEQTLAGHDAIAFTDEPGWSTTQRLDVGEWLDDYEVYFQWTVTHISSGQVWTSDEISHSVNSPYNNGNDVPVYNQAAGDHEWVVDLPDRTED